jgi:Fe-S cluster assembly iron-binding protein IscA
MQISKEARQLMDKLGKGIAISLNTTGCNGYSFSFSTTEAKGVTIDLDAHKYLGYGSKLIVKKDILSEELAIEHDHQTCGCGISFNV